MNERAVELYREACEFAYAVCKQEGRTGGPSDHIWNTLSTGRFAELVIKECANVAADHDALDIYEEIREHFGVEE